jgi:hypothetical protein
MQGTSTPTLNATPPAVAASPYEAPPQRSRKALKMRMKSHLVHTPVTQITLATLPGVTRDPDLGRREI